MMIHLYTDGGCRVNPGGIGAWGYVIVDDNEVIHQDSAYNTCTTNNRMEMQAIIEGFIWLISRNHKEVRLFSDSTICLNGLSISKAKYIKKGLDTRKNGDLWKQLYVLQDKLDNTYCNKVKAHSGNRWNDYADELCNEAMDIYAEIEV